MIFKGKLTHIFISPQKGQPMVPLLQARVIQAKGIEGDRYTTGVGRWNLKHSGKRQVTLINLDSFRDTGFEPKDSRRNLVVQGGELMLLINKKFTIGGILFRGVKYCYPCPIIDELSGKHGFVDRFMERGGLIAEVWGEGVIEVGNEVIEVVE